MRSRERYTYEICCLHAPIGAQLLFNPTPYLGSCAMAVAEYDVFLSHTWHDRDLGCSQQIYNRLTEAGLRVCVDAKDFEDFQSITQAVTEGLTKSKALLAYYSKIYPTRRACQWELTTAFLAGQSEGDSRRRVLVINPEEGSDHIHPVELRDAKYVPATKNGAEMRALADAVRQHVDKLEGPLPDVQPLKLPEWYGTSPPDRFPRFVGRFAEMWQIHSALHESDVAVINGATGKDIAQVAGLGGIGKSLLAREYALRFGSAYPGGVFWLRAYGNDNTKAALAPVECEAEQIDQLASFAYDIEAAVTGKTLSEVRSALARAIERQGQPCLWIVDDLPSGLNADEFVSWCAPHPLARTLITTRARTYDELGSTKGLITLDVLPENDAYQLFTSHRAPDSQAEEREARTLVRDLGCHALAIEVTGARLEKEEGLRSFREFRQELACHDKDVLEFAAELSHELPLGHEKSIVKTLLQSIERLEPEGRDFLRVASVLAVAPIPPKLVSAVFQRADGMYVADRDDTANRAMSQAEDLSLSQRGKGTGGACTVHTLVSRVVRFRVRNPERTAALRKAAVEVLRSAIAGVAADPRIRGESELHAAHARQVVSTLATVNEANLVVWLAQYDFERGSYASARMLYEREFEFRFRARGEEHPDTLRARLNLAQTLYAQGNLGGARQHKEHVLGASRRLLGEDHPNTLTARLNLANTLQAQGDLAGARQHQEQVHGASRRLLGEDHPDTLTARLNLASTLHAQGDLAGARQHEEQVLAASRRLLGEDHPDTLTARLNLASTLHAQGDLRARQHEEQVLAASRRLLGEDHPDTLTARNNLANTLHAQGDLAGARQHQEQVLAASRRLLGNEHPDTSSAAWNLFSTLRDLGEHDAARAVLKRDLQWLLNRDPKESAADQRKVRQHEAKAFETYGGTGKGKISLLKRIFERKPVSRS